MKAEFNLGDKRVVSEVIKSNHHTVIVETPDTSGPLELPNTNYIKRHKKKHNVIIKG